MKVSNPVIGNKYFYDYETCEKEKCNKYKGLVSLDPTDVKKVLLSFDCEYTPDYNALFIKKSDSVNSLFNTFGKVKYINKSGVVFYASVKDVTPATMKGKVSLETTANIKDAEELYLIINIRNKEYEIKIR